MQVGGSERERCNEFNCNNFQWNFSTTKGGQPVCYIHLLADNRFHAGYKEGYKDGLNNRPDSTPVRVPSEGSIPPPAKRMARSNESTETFAFPVHSNAAGATRNGNTPSSSHNRGASIVIDRFEEGVAYGKKVGYNEAEKALGEAGNEKFFKGVNFALEQCRLQLSVCNLWEDFKVKASELQLGLDDTFNLLGAEKEVIQID
jgi:hypothetical protein